MYVFCNIIAHRFTIDVLMQNTNLVHARTFIVINRNNHHGGKYTHKQNNILQYY